MLNLSDRNFFWVFSVIFLFILAFAVHTCQKIEVFYSTEKVVGTVIESGNTAYYGGIRCYFHISTAEGVMSCSGPSPNTMCPGTLDLCNNIGEGVQVQVEYSVKVRTNNTVLADGKTHRSFDRITSIRPIKEKNMEEGRE